MVPFRSVVFALLLLLLSAPLCLANPQESTPAVVTLGRTLSPDEVKSLMEKAKSSYASLAPLGFGGFRCEVTPDFDGLYASITGDEVGRTKVLPLLKQVRFVVVAGKDGGSSVSHISDVAPEGVDVSERMGKSLEGADQMIRGILLSWTPFAVNSPFAGPSEKLTIEELADGYRVKQTEGSTSVTIYMHKDYTAEKMEVITAKFTANMLLAWEATPLGWRMSGYDAKITPASGEKQTASINIEYQKVDGMSLPSIVRTAFSANGVSGKVDFRFTDCHVKKP